MIEVPCAIIEKDGLLLAAQRSERMILPLRLELSRVDEQKCLAL